MGDFSTQVDGTTTAGSKRGRAWLIVPALVISGATAGVLAVPHMGKPGAAIAAALRHPLSILDARSPGERPAGALTTTKPKKDGDSSTGSAPATRDERVLNNVRTRGGDPSDGNVIIPSDPNATVFDNTAPPTAGGDPGTPFAPVTQGVGAPLVAGVGGGGVFLPGGGGGTGGAGGTGDPGGTGGTGTVPTNPVTPAVPEPSTWLTMLVGFFALGFAMRRRRGVAASKAAHPARG